MKIYTWNILAKPLFTAKNYPKNDPGVFNLDERDRLICQEMTKRCQEKYIIGLQEVDTETYEKLVIIFNENDYEVYWVSNGNHLNDYMGIVLAWPREQYKLKRFRQLQTCGLAKEYYDIYSSLDKLMNPWLTILKRKNWILAAELQDKKSLKSFVVATCHVPRLYDIPHATYLCIDLLYTSLEKFAGSLPLFICGDFNFLPSSEAYMLLTNPTYRQKQKEIHVHNMVYFYQSQIKHTYTSLIKTAQGQEPLFTCRSALYSNDLFEGTLDYVFCTNVQISTVNIENIPTDNIIYPSYSNPSDHLPLVINLEF